jgi:phage-related protein
MQPRLLVEGLELIFKQRQIKSCTFGQHGVTLSPMDGNKLRRVTLYKNYFIEFFDKQKPKVKDKILWTLRLIETQRHIPSEYFDHIIGTDGLYEIRVRHGSDIYRVFCFFDEDQLILLANGFQKKTQKTPKSEIEKALKIKKEYEQEK